MTRWLHYMVNLPFKWVFYWNEPFREKNHTNFNIYVSCISALTWFAYILKWCSGEYLSGLYLPICRKRYSYWNCKIRFSYLLYVISLLCILEWTMPSYFCLKKMHKTDMKNSKLYKLSKIVTNVFTGNNDIFLCWPFFNFHMCNCYFLFSRPKNIFQ